MQRLHEYYVKCMWAALLKTNLPNEYWKSFNCSLYDESLSLRSGHMLAAISKFQYVIESEKHSTYSIIFNPHCFCRSRVDLAGVKKSIIDVPTS